MNLEVIKAKLQSLNTVKVEETEMVYPEFIGTCFDNGETVIGNNLYSLLSVEFSDDIPLYNWEGYKIKEQLIVTNAQIYENGRYVEDKYLLQVIPVIEIEGVLYERLDKEVPFLINKKVYDYLTSEEVTSYLNSAEFEGIFQEYNR